MAARRGAWASATVSSWLALSLPSLLRVLCAPVVKFPWTPRAQRRGGKITCFRVGRMVKYCERIGAVRPPSSAGLR